MAKLTVRVPCNKKFNGIEEGDRVHINPLLLPDWTSGVVTKKQNGQVIVKLDQPIDQEKIIVRGNGMIYCGDSDHCDIVGSGDISEVNFQLTGGDGPLPIIII